LADNPGFFPGKAVARWVDRIKMLVYGIWHTRLLYVLIEKSYWIGALHLDARPAKKEMVWPIRFASLGRKADEPA
jgi:hypothetical protein